VEEQFYLVFPTLFLVVARAKGALSIRTRMTVVLVGVIIVSFGLSVMQTATSPAAAYFSPFARAWELALGGLIAVSTPLLRKVPVNFASVMTWVGLGMILLSAFTFNSLTAYPGSAVAVPVLGAGLVIAGGVAARGRGVELVLGTRPFQWLGRRSYGWYLVHWPILIIASESQDKASLPGWESLLWVVGALGVAAVLFRFVEDPVRHLRTLPLPTVVVGAITVILTVIVLTVVIAVKTVGYHNYPVVPAPNVATVESEVAAAPAIAKLPSSVEPSADQAGNDWGGDFEPGACISGVEQLNQQICTLGDTKGTKLMVAFGDSHVLMWLPALNAIAKTAHLRLVVLSHWYCPTAVVTITNPPGYGNINQAFTACDTWRQWAIRWVNRHRPSLVVVSNEDLYRAPSRGSAAPTLFSSNVWEAGVTKLLDDMQVPGMRKVVLGNIPILPHVAAVCLSAHADNVQACSAHVAPPTILLDQPEALAAASSGAQYIDTTPWFCSATCTAVVKNYIVYMDQFHVSATYGRYLERVLGQALKLQ